MDKKGNNVVGYFKTNKAATAGLLFAGVSLIVILTAVLALKEFVVPVCVLVILEAGMAAFFHKAELWKHGILLAAQIAAGFIIGRGLLVIVCVIVYVAATVALQFISKARND